MKDRPHHGLAVVIALAVLFAVVATPTRVARDGTSSGEFMVSAANPLAAEAGRSVLAAGGSAVDAAIAVQAVLSLVEPQSSGIGGGAFMLHWDETERRLEAYDGRETAPAAVDKALFLEETGVAMSYFDAVVSGNSIGVPGVMAMLAMAHEEHGNLPWSDLFAPAIRLAEEGFEVSPRLNTMLAWSPALPRLPETRALYFVEPDEASGQSEPVPLPVGTVLKVPAYAATLRVMAQEGVDAFYRGSIARDIVEAVRNAPVRPGSMTLNDLEGYVPKKREPVCRPYRAYKVCGMPPPTSGGLAALQIIGLLEPFEMASLEPSGVDAVHLITEASRLAYADRDLYIADPDFVDVPVAGMMSDRYLKARSALISTERSLGPLAVPAGDPDGSRTGHLAPNQSVARLSTTHFSIVDASGNAVSVTSSVEAPFGSHMMAGGFLLNNQLTDFSFVPEVDGRPIANAVAPGKRPRSSMSPTMVFDENGDLYAVIGSPGGSRIIAFVTQTLVALIDWEMDMQSAIDLPRHVNRNGPLEIEADTALEVLIPELQALGHEVGARRLTSGLHGIRITEQGLEGGADPRREGVALSGRLQPN